MLLSSVLATIALATTSTLAQNITQNDTITTPYHSSGVNLGRGANLTTTLKAVWIGNSSQGIFNDGLSLLSGNVSSTIYGALLEFNTSSPINATSTLIPFVALVSCDDLVPGSAVASPSSITNSTDPASANSTLSSNSTASSNSTVGSNSTTSAANLTEETIIQAAASLGAQALILYSSSNQSCSLNSTLMNETTSIPVYSLPSQSSTRLLLQQFNYIGADYRQYNSTLLSEAASIYASALASRNTSIAIPFIVATITPNQTFENTSPIVATIGAAIPAGSSTTAMPSSTATGSVGSTTTSNSPSSSTSSPASSAAAPELGSSSRGVKIALALVISTFGVTLIW